MAHHHRVFDQDHREIVGLKASHLFRSMLDALDHADPRAPRLHRAPVPALVHRQLPALADPLDEDERQAPPPPPPPPPATDSGDPDPGTLQNDDGASLHFFGARPRGDLDEGAFGFLAPATRKAWWSLNLAACW
jgi:hypothetical protein